MIDIREVTSPCPGTAVLQLAESAYDVNIIMREKPRELKKVYTDEGD